MKRFALCLVLSLAAPVLAEQKSGQRAFDFEKQSVQGKSVKLSALRGKVVLVDFWASWCEPCKKELPLLDKMAARLRDKGVEVVTVNIDDRKENAEDFLKSHGLKQLTVVHDADKSIVGKYEPPKMPSSFIVDKAGIVRQVNAGFDPGDETKIEAQLTSLASK